MRVNNCIYLNFWIPIGTTQVFLDYNLTKEVVDPKVISWVLAEADSNNPEVHLEFTIVDPRIVETTEEIEPGYVVRRSHVLFDLQSVTNPEVVIAARDIHPLLGLPRNQALNGARDKALVLLFPS